MNKQEFKNIALGQSEIDAATVLDLQQMQKDFPFFALSFCILAKYYQNKQDFRTDQVLHQAALRIHNRQWLFDYIHTNATDYNIEKSDTAGEELEELSSVEIAITPEESLTPSLDNLKEIELQSPLPMVEPIAIVDEITSPEIIKTEETVESIDSLEADIIPQEVETFEDTISEIDPIVVRDIEIELNTKHSEVDSHTEIQSPLLVDSHEQDIQLNEIYGALNEDELSKEEENQQQIIEKEPLETTELNTVHSSWGLFTPDQPDNQIKMLFEPIVDQKPSTISNSERLITNRMSVYNIEDFFPVAEETKNSPIEGDASSDFYSWLNSNGTETDIPETPVEPKMDLIERFIKTSPSVSRPKTEFYTPEKAMKKSEQLPGGLVTETLANIYLKQGKPEKAIEAYSQLQLKIPQKKAYFADLIQKIKEENNLS